MRHELRRTWWYQAISKLFFRRRNQVKVMQNPRKPQQKICARHASISFVPSAPDSSWRVKWSGILLTCSKGDLWIEKYWWPWAAVLTAGGAAYLLKTARGMRRGVTLKLYDNERHRWMQSAIPAAPWRMWEYARSVAYALGMDHFVYNFSDEFRSQVMDRFSESYLKGETPNPCIDCNRFIKFKLLYDRAGLLGFDDISTGHYARISFDSGSERWLLKKGLDRSKDQTMFLYAMNACPSSPVLYSP